MTYTPVRMAINIVAHMVLFGLPIALAARAAASAATTSSAPTRTRTIA